MIYLFKCTLKGFLTRNLFVLCWRSRSRRCWWSMTRRMLFQHLHLSIYRFANCITRCRPQVAAKIISHLPLNFNSSAALTAPPDMPAYTSSETMPATHLFFSTSYFSKPSLSASVQPQFYLYDFTYDSFENFFQTVSSSSNSLPNQIALKSNCIWSTFQSATLYSSGWLKRIVWKW